MGFFKMSVKIRYTDFPVIRISSQKRPAENEFTLEEHTDVKVRILRGGEGCEFLLHDFTLEDVNKLRKIFYSSLETMAIEYLEFTENTTGFPDETIAHRLGLIPIKCKGVEDLPLVDEGEGCDMNKYPTIEEYSHCGVEFTLKKSLPRSSSKEK